MEPHLQGVEVEPLRVAMTISPSTTRPAGRALSATSCTSGKIAIERLQVAALDEDVIGAAKNDRAKPVPLRLVQERVRPAAYRPAWRAWARWAAARRSATNDRSRPPPDPAAPLVAGTFAPWLRWSPRGKDVNGRVRRLRSGRAET